MWEIGRRSKFLDVTEGKQSNQEEILVSLFFPPFSSQFGMDKDIWEFLNIFWTHMMLTRVFY